MDSASGSGPGKRKRAKGKKGLNGPPLAPKSGSSPSLERSSESDRPGEEQQVSGEHVWGAAEIIGECARLGLWEEARVVYDSVALASDETGRRGSGALARINLAQIQTEALSCLGKTMSGASSSVQQQIGLHS
jgi:hypothetical protein